MSKKDISRTAIEGGRSGFNKNERYISYADERSKVHTIIAGAHGDPEIFDEVLIPKRKKVYKDFKDKLSPVERWMNDRVGKSWNKTYSLLKKKFDSRTVAGRHIVYDHILRDIWMSPDRSDKFAIYHRYYIDNNGILRKTESWNKENKELSEKIKQEKIEIEKWLDCRMIGKTGNVLYWYNPTVKSHVEKFDWWAGKFNSVESYYNPRFIKGDRLSGRDIEFFTKLFLNHKSILLKNSKVITSCQCSHGLQYHVNDECRIPDCNCEVKWII